MVDDGDEQWRTLWKVLRRYLSNYGGRKAILRSPFFWVALFLAIGNFRLWHIDWISYCREILPSLLGFSLGTYAILFSIISSRIKRALKATENDGGIPYLDEMNATFFHFIFVQVLALILSYVREATFVFETDEFLFGGAVAETGLFLGANVFLGFLGTSLFFYSIALTVAAAMVVYRLAGIVDPQG
ncbi:hypothetical protein [uncultured Erythrobacter sp.]|uniref:hypothetical protein n=1 Tax=uncultured Erythrobacter sp. TaxID=263913 RepID=UPI00262C9A27|nr:hypothetical protein [uncultured Erythrobacter sp.]